MSVSLVLGSFDLINVGSDYETSVLAEGTSRGTPVPIEVAVKSWLQDGAIVVTQGYDNREVRVRVRFHGEDLVSLAEAEAVLFAELGKPNTLTWTPPDGSPASVFQVVTSSLEAEDDDMGEIDLHPYRTYTVRLVCEAFVRSAAEVVAPALPASGSTTTTVNNGSSTTGWAGSVNGVSATPSVSSGAVRVASTAVTGTVNVVATLTTAITTSTTKFLQVDWKPESTGGRPDIRAYGDGTALPLMAQYASPTAGYTRSWFYVAASSVAALRLESRSDVKAEDPALVRAIYVDNINRTDVQPSFGSSRQSMRTVDVSGSARTPGALTVEHSSSALGDVIVYVFPDGDEFNAYSPPLRQYRVAGGATVTTDAARVSGSSDDIKVAVSTFDVPVTNVLSGLHTLVARLTNPTATNTVSWTVATFVNGTQVGAATSGSTDVPVTSGYANFALGRAMLPTVDLSESLTNAVVRVTLTESTTVGSATLLDEAWLFNTGVGQLTMVACGTGAAAVGGPARRLFIDPPRVTRPRPAILVGHSADRSDAYFPASGATAWTMPQFVPPRARVFVVTSNATEPSITLKHTPAWHTHAAS